MLSEEEKKKGTEGVGETFAHCIGPELSSGSSVFWSNSMYFGQFHSKFTVLFSGWKTTGTIFAGAAALEHLMVISYLLHIWIKIRWWSCSQFQVFTDTLFCPWCPLKALGSCPWWWRGLIKKNKLRCGVFLYNWLMDWESCSLVVVVFTDWGYELWLRVRLLTINTYPKKKP